MINVAILNFNNAALFELGCAVELFALERPEFKDWYKTEVVSFEDGPSATTAGIQISCKTIDSLDNYDLVIIPSWKTEDRAIPQNLKQQLCAFYKQGKRLISFCSGAFLLAELGILNYRKATTHWRYAELFKQRFTHSHYVDDVLYVYDGVIGCSAGSSAAIDLGLEVIRSDFGYQIANKVARRLVLSAHRKGGQSQFAELPMSKQPNQFSIALDWAIKNVTNNFDIDRFAQKANMSRRTFDRRFKANLNITPKEWLTHQRLNIAKELLESHHYDIEKIAELSGFENATTMRHHFRKEYGVSPSIHRSQFKSTSRMQH